VAGESIRDRQRLSPDDSERALSFLTPGLAFAPGLHVSYGEKVLAVKHGLPKFDGFPRKSFEKSATRG
jgi:hypothetical protein